MDTDLDFSVTVERQDDRVRVMVVGDLDLATADLLVSRTLVLLAGVTAVCIDLHDVEFIDSSGMRALLSLRELLIESGTALMIGRPSRAVQRMFAMTAVADLLPVEPEPS